MILDHIKSSWMWYGQVMDNPKPGKALNMLWEWYVDEVKCCPKLLLEASLSNSFTEIPISSQYYQFDLVEKICGREQCAVYVHRAPFLAAMLVHICRHASAILLLVFRIVEFGKLIAMRADIFSWCWDLGGGTGRYSGDEETVYYGRWWRSLSGEVLLRGWNIQFSPDYSPWQTRPNLPLSFRF